MPIQVLTDEQWRALEPLLNEVRPWAARPIRALRRTIEAIVWRHENGAKWRAIPESLGPWWMAAQTFIRWAKLAVWERLHRLAQERRGLELGMVFLDGSVIRAHQKAAGARKEGLTSGASAEAQALGRSRGARPCGRSPTAATPAMPCARRSVASAPPRPSRPAGMRPRWHVATGSTPIASGSSGCGRGSRNGGRWRRATIRRPDPSSAS